MLLCDEGQVEERHLRTLFFSAEQKGLPRAEAVKLCVNDFAPQTQVETGVVDRVKEVLEGIRKRGLEKSAGELESNKKPRGMMDGPERSTRQEETVAAAESEAKESTIWNQKPKVEVTKEDEFEEYFAGMFP